MLSILG